MSVLVTGANRGIGLEFVKQLAKYEPPPKYIFATYRSKGTTEELENIKKSSDRTQVILIQADVTQKGDVERLRKSIEDLVGDKGLNLLINNAGVLRTGTLENLTEEDLMFHFKTNTIGPVSVLKEMLPLLEKADSSKDKVRNLSKSTVLNITSMMGSIGNLDKVPPELVESIIGYRTSKAALNMAMRSIALVLKDKGVLVFNMCPGWVQTDMGTANADIEVNESVSNMLGTLPTLDQSRHGDFMDRHGKAIAYWKQSLCNVLRRALDMLDTMDQAWGFHGLAWADNHLLKADRGLFLKLLE